MVVNGRTWPFLEVEQRRYRFRLLNGCNSRFLILKMSIDGLPFWQIGNDGGFLDTPVELERVLLAPAERADVIVDFTHLPLGTEIVLLNLGRFPPGGPRVYRKGDAVACGLAPLNRREHPAGRANASATDSVARCWSYARRRAVLAVVVDSTRQGRTAADEPTER
jgi:FtsP/CotA-like multicopper oxidase with cupredoxin domain